ncbi:MAG: glycoside hydrolase family 2 protein, partial [Armatimonadota bacterium]
DLPLGFHGKIGINAKDQDSESSCEVDSADISSVLTPISNAKRNRLSLEGAWEIAMDPPQELLDTSNLKWNPITVPSHWEMKGFKSETGRALYRKTFTIPANWTGKRTKFRSDGIYSKCRVWMNGKHVGNHDGGVTPFEIDITNSVKPGFENTITIQVEDKSDAGQFDAMSYYAHLNIGGIWRPLEVFCVELAHISRLAVDTKYDGTSSDFNLTATIDVANEQNTAINNADLALRLRDPKGRQVDVEGLSAKISLGPWERKTLTLTTKVKSPETWSAESPSLYSLTAKLKTPGSSGAAIEQKIGLKEVRINGRAFTVNRQPVRLWGVCRHDADPVNGRAIDAKLAHYDIELMKGCNLNAMRTSHYPPHPEALNAADAKGLYVEDEAPNCFAGVSYGPPTGGRDFVNDLRLAPLCVSLASALLERDRNHPSVVIWSVCNESLFGKILDLAYDFIKDSDPTRPVSAGQSGNLDIATYHNPTSLQRLKDTADFTMPVLFDEGFAIFQGFGAQAGGLELDPGLRDFWVTAHHEPLKGILKSEHQFGSMIWAWADDAFLVPGKGIEYGRRNQPRTYIVDTLYSKPGFGITGDPMWGVVDGWRRPRPEWWLCKKLFSPIQIEEKPLKAAANVMVEIENRNYFINLNRYLCKWSIGNRHGELRADIKPLSHGTMSISVEKTPSADDIITLEFYDESGRMTDGYNFCFKELDPVKTPASGKPAKIIDEQGTLDFAEIIRLVGNTSELAYDRTSGALIRGLANNKQVLFAGPNLHIMKSWTPIDQYPPGWKFIESKQDIEDGFASLNWNGQFGADFKGGYEIKMDDTGYVEFRYDFTYNGVEFPAHEIGMKFEIPHSCDKFEWERNAEWSYYPDDHIGRPHGITMAHSKAAQTIPPGKRPFGQDDHPWGCNDFRSVKRDIRQASFTDATGAGIRILSDGSQHVRATVGIHSITVNILDYYGGSATGTGEWDGTYGIGKIIKPGDRLHGTIRIQLISGM